MDHQNEKKTVLITGASKGLGKALALRLCRKMELVLVARSKELLSETQDDVERISGARPLAFSCDVSSEQAVAHLGEALSTRLRRLDVVINNAGIGCFRPSLKLAPELLRQQFEVNVFAPFYVTRHLLPLLNQSDAGYILNIGSLFSRISLAENSIYAASKYALVGYTEGLARELRGSRIRVGIFHPGPMPTAFHDNGHGEAQVSSPVVLDMEAVTRKIERMIRRRRSASVFYPWWMLPLLRLRQRVADTPRAAPTELGEKTRTCR